jgi:hypothetical protein
MTWETDIERMDFEDLKTWVWSVLSEESPSPVPHIYQDAILPYEYPEMAYKNIHSPVFRSRMDKAIVDLFVKFNLEISESLPELRYFANLSYLIARLRIIEAAHELFRKINSGYFIGQPTQPSCLPFSVPDLQFLLLKVLLEFSSIRDSSDIFKRFLHAENGLYAHICYRGLWECDRTFGIVHLPDLIGTYLHHTEKHFDFVTEFGFYLKVHFLFFLQAYDKIELTRSLDEEETGLMFQAIEEFTSFSNYEIVWDTDSQERYQVMWMDPKDATSIKCIDGAGVSSLTTRLLMARYSRPNHIVQLPMRPLVGAGSNGASGPYCDPNEMRCFQIKPGHA